MPITPTNVDPGDDTIGMRPNSYLAKLKDERSQSPYKDLEVKIFKRVMSELTFSVPSGKYVSKLTSVRADVREVPVAELFKDAPNTKNELELCIRNHAEARVVEFLRETVGYRASEPTYDPGNLTGAIHTFFSDNVDVKPKEKLAAIDAIAAEEIAAFRDKEKAANKFRSA